MPSVNIYLDDESYDLKKKIPKGEVSRIVQNAIKEHIGAEIDLEAVEKKLEIIDENIKKLQHDKKFWKEKAESMRIVEKGKIATEKKEREKSIKEEKEEKRKQKTKAYDSLLKSIKENFIINDDKAEKLTKEYLNYKKDLISKGKNFIGWSMYILHKDIKKNER